LPKAVGEPSLGPTHIRIHEAAARGHWRSTSSGIPPPIPKTEANACAVVAANGPPGLRQHDHADFYGPHFRDIEGNKLCVACHEGPAAWNFSSACG
jgi:hypothetical protein